MGHECGRWERWTHLPFSLLNSIAYSSLSISSLTQLLFLYCWFHISSFHPSVTLFPALEWKCSGLLMWYAHEHDVMVLLACWVNEFSTWLHTHAHLVFLHIVRCNEIQWWKCSKHEPRSVLLGHKSSKYWMCPRTTWESSRWRTVKAGWPRMRCGWRGGWIAGERFPTVEATLLSDAPVLLGLGESYPSQMHGFLKWIVDQSRTWSREARHSHEEHKDSALNKANGGYK